MGVGISLLLEKEIPDAELRDTDGKTLFDCAQTLDQIGKSKGIAPPFSSFIFDPELRSTRGFTGRLPLPVRETYRVGFNPFGCPLKQESALLINRPRRRGIANSKLLGILLIVFGIPLCPFIVGIWMVVIGFQMLFSDGPKFWE